MTPDVAPRPLRPARLRPRDIIRVGLGGMRARPTRTVLSALGVALGIATMVSVIGISASSQEGLLRQLDALGTNLLRVQPGHAITGEPVRLPPDAAARVRRIEPVTAASAIGEVTGASVRRTHLIPAVDTGDIMVQAADVDLLHALDGAMHAGVWLNQGTARYPTVVLGSVAAERLGINRTGIQVYIGGRWFAVTGVLRPLPLAPEIDRSALVGFPTAQELLGFDGHPTTLYERSTEKSVAALREILPRTIDPESPQNVAVSNPSDALAARATAAGAFTNLLLGLGSVALLVGAVGIANTMIISVLERRREISLRRAIPHRVITTIGARRHHGPARRLPSHHRLRSTATLATRNPGMDARRRTNSHPPTRPTRRPIPSPTSIPITPHHSPNRALMTAIGHHLSQLASSLDERCRPRRERPSSMGTRHFNRAAPQDTPGRCRSLTSQPPRSLRGPGHASAAYADSVCKHRHRHHPDRRSNDSDTGFLKRVRLSHIRSNLNQRGRLPSRPDRRTIQSLTRGTGDLKPNQLRNHAHGATPTASTVTATKCTW